MKTAVDKDREFYLEDLKGLVNFRKNFEKHRDFVNEHLAGGYGFEDVSELSGKQRLEFTIMLIAALKSEAQEVLDELPWKPWKDDHGDPGAVDPERVREEIVDVQHFVNNLIMAWFDNLEQFDCYFRAKLDENVRRQEEGY